MKCGLCQHDANFFQEVSLKNYFECPHCGLVFLDPAHRLSEQDELTHYRLHQNHPADVNYRNFLKPAFTAVQSHAVAVSKGIDFGCGPGPTLSVMCEEAGFRMKHYDKYFFPDPAPLRERYDFVTCTEVIEHIAELDVFIQQLIDLLEPGKGLIVIMTKLLQFETDFKSWHYRIDPTHISFLTPQTVKFISQRYQLTLLELTGQLIVLQKGE